MIMFHNNAMISQAQILLTTLCGTLFLSASALLSLITTWASLADPSSFGRRLGLTAEVPDGLNEIRAQYGGFFCAVAIIDALALMGILRRDVAYVLNAAVFSGLFLGRMLSLFLDGRRKRYGSTIGALFFIDGAGTLLSFASLLLERRV